MSPLGQLNWWHMMKREWFPYIAPIPPAWSNRRVHEDPCRCERCAHHQVNGHAPKE